jgi:hypothetical protein
MRFIEVIFKHGEENGIFLDRETGEELNVVEYTCFDTDSDLTPAEVVETAVNMRNAELDSHKTLKHLELVNLYDEDMERFFCALLSRE